MSSSEFLRSTTTTESSIPVPKKPLAGTKRSKGCARLPELQRYIETIIKASSECESEDAALPERGTGFPRERKFGRYSVCKGRERAKRESHAGGRKSKNKAKTPFTEAVSTGGGEVASFSVSDFDDPRNWRTDGTRNGGPDPEIGNFLEKHFPNPYHLPPDSVPEIREKDALGDPVPVSNVHSVRTQTEVQSESTDDAFFTADIAIKPCTRESIVTLSIGPASSEENCERPVSRRGGVRGSNVSRVATPPSLPAGNRSSRSTVNVSSRPSSVESVGGKSQTPGPKAKRSRLKRLALEKSAEKEENPSDSDIGKLKLLSMTDSDDSVARGTGRRREDEVKQTVSRRFDQVYECGDLSNLRQIFDVMNNGAESFVEVTIKTEPTGFEFSENTGNEKLIELLKDLTEKSSEDERQLRQYECENYSVMQEITTDENVDSAQEGTITRRTSLTNFFQKEMYDFVKEKEKEKSSDEESVRQVEENIKLRAATEYSEEADQKVDEVLQYMYDCLKKFSNSESNKSSEIYLLEDKKECVKSQEGQEMAKSEQHANKESDHTTLADDGTDSFFVKRCRRVKEIQSESCTFLDDSRRKSMTRTRYRKKDKNSPLSIAESPSNGRPSTSTRSSDYAAARGLEAHSTADSLRICRDDLVQMVETQNELGSYSEQVAGDSHSLKSSHPQSIRLKKGKTDSQRTIKEVLEAEERLLANYLNPKPEKKVLEKIGDAKTRKSGGHVVVRKGGTAAAYPFITNFKRSNSNFVICVSSLPRNLRTMAANKTSLTLSPSISLSLNDINKSWQIKPITYYSKSTLKKIPVISDIGLSALQFKYNVQQGSLLTGDKSSVVYTARPVCLKQICCYPKPREEFALQTSICCLTVLVSPGKKSPLEDSSTARNVDNCLSAQTAETENGRRVDSLLEALERTEGRLMLLEQNEFVNSETASSSGNETYKCDTSEMEWEGENGQEKVHDLLMRTYSLQHKLQRYLHKKTHTQPIPICPLMHHEQCWRLSLMVKENHAANAQDSEQSEKPRKVSQVVTTGVQTSDHTMSSKLSGDKSEKEIEESHNENGEDQNEDDDDNSSVCSFKSSNDFSETTDPKPPQRGEFLQKIFNEIESFKQNFRQAKKDASSEGSNENSETPKENRIAKYDPKMPTKMLRTVFKGKKSLTELTIGLKDVPMTKVSNISVEKRKFSPNHTKISICILKEKPEKSNTLREPELRTNGNALHNKFSTLYFDKIRPSLSRCRTNYTKVEDDNSKTSESINESSEDDDDDYKSVASSPSSPDVTNRPEAKDDVRKPTPAPQKTFTKYRFDFYRKMDMSLDAAQTRPKPLSNTMCHYKELEPLKQALTEMQIRMRSIKQDNFYIGSDYYERALKLAKMSAGYCQSCGNRTVIPKDTFGYYKSLLPRRCSGHRHGRNFKMAASNPSYYSFRSSNGDSFCDLDIRQSSSYLLNRPNAPFLRSSLHDMPILIGRI